MFTYIIKTNRGEYYCGKTNNIERRIKEHLEEKKPHWFVFNGRKNFNIIFKINEDVEKDIKRFGIAKFVRCLRS